MFSSSFSSTHSAPPVLTCEDLARMGLWSLKSCCSDCHFERNFSQLWMRDGRMLWICCRAEEHMQMQYASLLTPPPPGTALKPGDTPSFVLPPESPLAAGTLHLSYTAKERDDALSLAPVPPSRSYRKPDREAQAQLFARYGWRIAEYLLQQGYITRMTLASPAFHAELLAYLHQFASYSSPSAPYLAAMKLWYALENGQATSFTHTFYQEFLARL